MTTQSNISLSQITSSLKDNILSIFRDIAELFALESRLASKSIGKILGLMIVIALLIATTWFLLVAAGTALLINLGLDWHTALFGMAGLNLLLIGVLGCLIKSYFRNLHFSATRRQLQLTAKQLAETKYE